MYNIAIVKARVLVNIPEGYYSFSKAGFRFIILNSFDLNTASGNNKKREQAELLMDRLIKEGAVHVHDWNGGIGQEQIKWLKQNWKILSL